MRRTILEVAGALLLAGGVPAVIWIARRDGAPVRSGDREDRSTSRFGSPLGSPTSREPRDPSAGAPLRTSQPADDPGLDAIERIVLDAGLPPRKRVEAWREAIRRTVSADPPGDPVPFSRKWFLAAPELQVEALRKIVFNLDDPAFVAAAVDLVASQSEGGVLAGSTYLFHRAGVERDGRASWSGFESVAAPALTPLLDSPRSSVRTDAAFMLWTRTAHPAECGSLLVARALTDPDSEARVDYVAILGRRPEGLSHLADALERSADDAVRMEAATSLAYHMEEDLLTDATTRRTLAARVSAMSRDGWSVGVLSAAARTLAAAER